MIQERWAQMDNIEIIGSRAVGSIKAVGLLESELEG